MNTKCLCLLWLLASCSGSNPPSSVDAGPKTCSVRFSGNYADALSSNDVCPKLAQDAADWELTVSAPSSVAGATTSVKIDLGPSPGAGTYTDGTVSAWSAIALTDSGCEYAAGNTAVPSGGFTLSIGHLSGQTAHGSLSIIEHVAAPQGVDCGDGDFERIDFAF